MTTSSPAAGSGRRMTTSPRMPSPMPSARRSACARMRARCWPRITPARGWSSTRRGMRMARIPDGAQPDRQPGVDRAGVQHRQRACDGGRAEHLSRRWSPRSCRRSRGATRSCRRSLRVNRGEGEIAGAFGALAAEYPDLSMGSYPFIQNGAHGTNLVIRGTDAGQVAEAMTRLAALFPETPG